MNTCARMGLGAIGGVTATYLMDAVTEIFYTESIRRREHEIQPATSAEALAEKLLRRLDLHPSSTDIKRIAPLLHWGFGIASGMLAGALAKDDVVEPSLAVGAGMLAFDEVGLSLLGAAPPSTRYPWQTHLRSIAGHAAYVVSLTIAYETVRAVVARCNCHNGRG